MNIFIIVNVKCLNILLGLCREMPQNCYTDKTEGFLKLLKRAEFFELNNSLVPFVRYFGIKASLESFSCVQFLKAWWPSAVIYVCTGSLPRFSSSILAQSRKINQIFEIRSKSGRTDITCLVLLCFCIYNKKIRFAKFVLIQLDTERSFVIIFSDTTISTKEYAYNFFHWNECYVL